MDNQAATTEQAKRHAIIERAISEGANSYLEGCEARIDDFVKKHYSLRGALNIHAHALGFDLLRVPLNIIWSVVNIALALLALLAGLLQLNKLQTWLKNIPPGIETDLDRQISWLIITELLQLPHKQGNRSYNKDALMEAILQCSELKQLIDAELENIDIKIDNPGFRQELDRKLAEYGATRTGASELASNTIMLITSKVTLGQASFGALSAGSAVSAAVAHSIAVSNFWLGSTLGAYYYAIIPATVSMRLIIAMTALVSIILVLLSTFIGIITDPIQAKLGLHQQRLRKLIESIEQDLQGETDGQFHLREKYAGRIFDIVDFLSILRHSS